MHDLTPVTKKLNIIDAGIGYDILKGKHKRLADDFLSKWYGKNEAQIPNKKKKEITQLYSDIKTNVHLRQMDFRNEALLDAGIPKPYLPGMRVPFRHDKNLRLIMPVEESIAQKVEGYYQPFKYKKPVTRIYGNLVGIKPLKDELTGGIETSRKQVKYLWRHVKKP